MDAEQHSDFKSAFAKFQDGGRSQTLPPSSPPAQNISNVRSNPALLNVIASLENQPKPLPPPVVARKPDLAAKPNFGNKPTSLPSKEKISAVKNDMWLNKGLRHTLYITDAPRSDGDGVCSRSPQVYRQSWSASPGAKVPPGQNAIQSDQDCYEVIDDSFKATEKPQLPSKGHLNSQISNVSRPKPFQALGTNHSNAQDCYETVDDAIRVKPSPPFKVGLKSKQTAFPEHKPSPMVEANQSDSKDCYEVVDDAIRGNAKPQLPLKTGRKLKPPAFSEHKPSPMMEATQSDSRNCYEIIDDNIRANAKPPLPLKAGLKPKPPAFLEPSPMDSQDCYEVVDDAIRVNANPPLPFLADLKPKPSAFPEHKHSPMTEANRPDSQDVYEVVDDALQTQVNSPPGFASHSSFSKALPGPAMSMSDGQECYQDVGLAFQGLGERLPPFGGNAEDQVVFPDPPNFSEIDELDGQDSYEAADSIFHIHVEPPPPFNDSPKPQSYWPSVKTNLKPVSPESCPNKEDKPSRPPDVKSKPKKNILPVMKMPRKKPLPTIEWLGPPPSKEPRPPQVDLTSYRSATPLSHGVPRPPRESAETEYESPAPSPSSQQETPYDDTMDIRALQESETNVYEVEELQPETAKLSESKPYFPSPDPQRGSEAYEDIATLRGSAGDSNVYEVEESGFAPAPDRARDSYWEVPGENKDFRAGNSDGDRRTLPRSDSKDGKISKSELAFRKKFKITGLEDTMYATTIVLDFKPEKYMLPAKRGDVVDVIRITDCPQGKWLVKDSQGNYGFVPVSCVDISKDILRFSNQHLLTTSASSDLYADVERPYDSGVGTDLSITSDNYSVKSDDTYDDIDNKSSTLNNSSGRMKGFGNLFKKDKSKKEESGSPSATLNSNVSAEEGAENSYLVSIEGNAREKEDKSSTWRSLFQKVKEQKGKTESQKNEGKGNTLVATKKINKEEKILREKFKYTGDINVVSVATINDSALLSSKDKMQLHVKPGETVDVIDVTNEDQIICRNAEGKFGYVKIECLNFQGSY
ncbi:FYN-binding protein 2 [Mantella aurantiaca]